MEKCFEDVRQDEKHVPDLLEAIIRPTDPVKDELRKKLFKITHISSKIKKMRVSKFWIPEFRSFRAAGQHSLLAQHWASRFSARNGLPYPNKSDIWPR